MPDSGVFSDTPGFQNYIGGLLSDSKANTYSQFFTGTMHSFTWADSSYYSLSSDFETNFVESCPVGCSLSKCRKGSSHCLTCGDGALNSGEACDDNNTSSGDGCSSNCAVEDGYTCSRSDNTAASPDLCVAGGATSKCGNGLKEPGEDCDDAVLEDGQLCH